MAWTSPKTFTANSVLTASELNTHLRDNLKAATEWTAYTPTWTATGGTPTIGNGILTGRYISAGDLCHVNIALTIGSTTSLGTTTAWTWALPVTAAGSAAGHSWALYWGNTYYVGASLIDAGSTSLRVLSHGSGDAYGYNVPFTWTANSRLIISATYEI